MSINRVRIAPSVLSADFTRIGEEVAELERAGADRLHVDVMDGLFVPQITMGQPVVRSLRACTKLPIEIHLMIVQPERYVEEFAECGADTIIVHQEACVHLHRTVEAIKACGKRVGVAINPATPAAMLSEILPYLDLVLTMTVNPGFSGQKFIETVVPKIAEVRRMLDDSGLQAVEIEADGGIDETTLTRALSAGASVFVTGAALFRPGIPLATRMSALLSAGNQL